MFTGIIRHMGIVEDVRTSSTEGRSALTIMVDIKDLDAKVGDSIAVNGVCLTVVERHGSRFKFNLIGETIRRSNLGSLRVGDRVNIEPSLRVGDSIDGHFVLGHVDCTGIIVDKVEERDQVRMSIKVEDRELMRYIVEKGSIAVDGVSLTVVSTYNDVFTVALIPHTLNMTTLGSKDKNDKVNIEIDVLARYVNRSTNILVT
jgi:riboflavin synthase